MADQVKRIQAHQTIHELNVHQRGRQPAPGCYQTEPIQRVPQLRKYPALCRVPDLVYNFHRCPHQLHGVRTLNTISCTGVNCTYGVGTAPSSSDSSVAERTSMSQRSGRAVGGEGSMLPLLLLELLLFLFLFWSLLVLLQ